MDLFGLVAFVPFGAYVLARRKVAPQFAEFATVAGAAAYLLSRKRKKKA